METRERNKVMKCNKIDSDMKKLIQKYIKAVGDRYIMNKKVKYHKKNCMIDDNMEKYKQKISDRVTIVVFDILYEACKCDIRVSDVDSIPLREKERKKKRE